MAKYNEDIDALAPEQRQEIADAVKIGYDWEAAYASQINQGKSGRYAAITTYRLAIQHHHQHIALTRRKKEKEMAKKPLPKPKPPKDRSPNVCTQPLKRLFNI